MAQTAKQDDEARPPLTAIVGANVYRLRILHGVRGPKVSQGALAAKAGKMSPETLRVIEAGRDPTKRQLKLRLDTLARLAEALEVDPAELLRWDETTRVYLHGEPPALAIITGQGSEHRRRSGDQSQLWAHDA